MVHLNVALMLVCFIMGISLAFAAPITLQGAGSAIPADLYQNVFFAYRYVQPDVDITYTAMNSGSGICRIESYTAMCASSDTAQPTAIDFSSSSDPLGASDYAQYPDLQMYPTLACAVVPIYNLPGSPPLILTLTALGQIYTGEIQVWDDPRIVASNPNFTSWGIPPNQPIEVVVLADANDVTYIYKLALANFYPNFTLPASSSATWGNLLVTPVSQYQRLNTYVANTPFTIGYSTLGQASDFHLTPALLSRTSLSGAATVVEATAANVMYAVLELGASFGNDGDPASRLTASLEGAQGVLSWPIVGYSYLVVRKNTLRSGMTCAGRQALVDFWQWFWTSQLVASMAEVKSLATLPSIVANSVTSQFLQDMQCNNNSIWQPPQLAQITGTGKSAVKDVYQMLGEVYGLMFPTTNVSYISANVRTDSDVQNLLSNGSTFLAASYPNMGTIPDVARLVFSGVGFLMISSFTNLVLDVPTILAILQGNITTWLDPAIAALNPGGLVDAASGLNLTNASQPILLMGAVVATSDVWTNMMLLWDPTYTGAALTGGKTFPDETSLKATVAGTSYSLGVTSITGNLGGATAASIKRSDGNIVAPTWQAVQACASPDVYDLSSNTFTLQFSVVTTCYPISQANYIFAHTSLCNMTTDPDRTATVAFVEWLFGGETDSALEQLNIAPLRAISPVVNEFNAAGLNLLTCNATQVIALPLGPILGGTLGALSVLGLVIGFYAYRSSKEMRAMRKRLSDDNVAEECAQAIAGFNLEAVAWLTDVQRPSRIQRSFLQIINLLTEVKPFIPDQLMTKLQGASGERQSDGPESLVQDQVVAQVDCVTDYSTATSKDSGSHHSQKYAKPSLPQTAISSYPTDSFDNSGAIRKEPRGQKGQKVSGDHTRRTITYLYARFSLSDSAIDSGTRATLMTALAAHIIVAGKTHGATIDSVAFDAVALHWNVSHTVSTASLRATTLALELANGLRAILPTDRQAALRLAVGVGHGLCSITTVIAAAHRFFVVGGPAVSTAVELVMLGYPSKVQCAVLVTDSAWHEVQYTVECLPRALYNDVLLWEPLRLRGAGGVSADEWMYELHHMEDDDHGTREKSLLELYNMARSKQPHDAIRQRALELQAAHTALLTPQDIAAINLLLHSLCPAGL